MTTYFLNHNGSIIAAVVDYETLPGDKKGQVTVAFRETFNDEGKRIPVKTHTYKTSTDKSRAKLAAQYEANGILLKARKRDGYWFLE